MINQLYFIMADNHPHDSIGRLLTYLDYRFNSVWYYPIPMGEWDLWGSAGPETEFGTALRLLRDGKYDAKDVARWLTILADNYMLDTRINQEDVEKYRRRLKE